jgi:Right handed beta helix region
MLLNAFRSLFSNSPNRKARRASARPQLLQLESRIVPATITVTTTSDAGGHSGISLRDAIGLANNTAGNDDIVFNTGVTTVQLLSSLPSIASAGTLTITGPGASSLTISGNNGGSGRNFNIFNIASGGNLSISGVTVTGAQTTGDGGAFNNAGTLTIDNSTISGNTSSLRGGGIYNQGNLTVSNSTISGNTATFNGGGIYNNGNGTVTVSNSTISGNTTTFLGGGIFSTVTVTVSNSTISGNTSGFGGGGIYNRGTVTVSNSTLSGNTASVNGGAGGGIFNNGIFGGTLNIANTIIANSISGGDYAGGVTNGTNTNNLVSQGSFSWATTKTSAEINLDSSLKNNGGPTETLALLNGSLAINTGNATISNASPIMVWISVALSALPPLPASVHLNITQLLP